MLGTRMLATNESGTCIRILPALEVSPPNFVEPISRAGLVRVDMSW